MGKRGVKIGTIRGSYKREDDKRTVVTFAIQNHLLQMIDELAAQKQQKGIKSKSAIVNQAIKEYFE